MVYKPKEDAGMHTTQLDKAESRGTRSRAMPSWPSRRAVYAKDRSINLIFQY